MARFNVPIRGSSKTVNYEGDVAYKLRPDLELYTAVCDASLQFKFYERNSEEILKRIRALMRQNSPEYIAKLAVYAREKMNLRSIPLVLTVELSKIHNGDALVGKLTERIIQRADEITEILAYYQKSNEREGLKKLAKLSKQLSRGIATAFHKFDEYQMAKYDRDNEVSLRDAMFLTHPKPLSEEESNLFTKIANKSLETPYTWETALSALGQQKFENEDAKKAAFKAKWEELIDSKKLGYMATLRNLRNILNANVSIQHIQKIATYLSNDKAVATSRQFPFRFLAAYRELSGDTIETFPSSRRNQSAESKEKIINPYTSAILDALEDAIKISADTNIAGYDYNTNVLIACDTSGSMRHPISERSSIMYYDIGLVLGMLLQNKCKSVITGIFGERWAIKHLPKSAILQNVRTLYSFEGEVGYSTNGYLAVQWLLDNKVFIDKVCIFTDCQLWNSRSPSKGLMTTLWNRYVATMNQNAKLYLFDLAGYGNTPVSVDNGNVYIIAGWSDKIFEILDAIEHGSSAVEYINSKIEL